MRRSQDKLRDYINKQERELFIRRVLEKVEGVGPNKDGEFSLSNRRKFFLCNNGEEERYEKKDKFIDLVVENRGSI